MQVEVWVVLTSAPSEACMALFVEQIRTWWNLQVWGKGADLHRFLKERWRGDHKDFPVRCTHVRIIGICAQIHAYINACMHTYINTYTHTCLCV